MSEDQLRDLLGAAAPDPGSPDTPHLWTAGRARRRRRTTGRAAVLVAMATVLVVGVTRIAVDDRGEPLRVLGSTPGTPGTAPGSAPGGPGGPVGPTGTARPLIEVLGSVEPGPPIADGSVVAPEFRLDFSLSRNVVIAGDGGEVEGRLSPDPMLSSVLPVSIAVPLTMERHDPVTGAWTPEFDLYDMSRNPDPAEAPYWRPHDTDEAWYERTAGPWGLPLRVPDQDAPPGQYRVCVQAWLTIGPYEPKGDGVTGTTDLHLLDTAAPGADRLSALSVPDDAVTMCQPLEVRASDAPAPADPRVSDLRITIDRIGLDAPVVRAQGFSDLQEAVGILPGSVDPGEAGLSVIAGHRTTFRADFLRLDQLRPGDLIDILRADGTGVSYQVIAEPRLVDAEGPVDGPAFGIPSSVFASFATKPAGALRELRLVTFAPTYSAAQRLVVDAIALDP